MTKIAIEIDTKDQEPKALSGKMILTPQQLGILSSVSLPTKLRSAIEAGYNVKNNPFHEKSGYDSTAIKNNEGDLISNQRCQFIIAVGGSVVHSAINVSSSVPFVSLVGAIPANVSISCLGGVSLESWPSNRDRIAILLTRLSPATISTIGLYQNPHSQMANDERDDWNRQFPPGSASTVFPATTFSGSTIINYDQDFNGTSPTIPSTIQGLVISADPQFQDDKISLVRAANTWVSAPGTNRYIVYPLQIYSEATPAPGKTTLYGPDLYQAYYRLGQLARSASDNQSYVGFERAQNLTVNV